MNYLLGMPDYYLTDTPTFQENPDVVSPLQSQYFVAKKPPGFLEQLLSDPAMVNALLTAGANMLAMSGPQKYPVSLGQIVGRGLLSGLESYGQYKTAQAQQELMRKKLEEQNKLMREKLEEQRKVNEARIKLMEKQAKRLEKEMNKPPTLNAIRTGNEVHLINPVTGETKRILPVKDVPTDPFARWVYYMTGKYLTDFSPDERKKFLEEYKDYERDKRRAGGGLKIGAEMEKVRQKIRRGEELNENDYRTIALSMGFPTKIASMIQSYTDMYLRSGETDNVKDAIEMATNAVQQIMGKSWGLSGFSWPSEQSSPEGSKEVYRYGDWQQFLNP